MIDEEATARAQGLRHPIEHSLVLVLLVEVAERREHVDHRIERSFGTSLMSARTNSTLTPAALAPAFASLM